MHLSAGISSHIPTSFRTRVESTASNILILFLQHFQATLSIILQVSMFICKTLISYQSFWQACLLVLSGIETWEQALCTCDNILTYCSHGCINAFSSQMVMEVVWGLFFYLCCLMLLWEKHLIRLILVWSAFETAEQDTNLIALLFHIHCSSESLTWSKPPLSF